MFKNILTVITEMPCVYDACTKGDFLNFFME